MWASRDLLCWLLLGNDMASSPAQKALKWIRDQGYTADVAEYWNHFARRRKDLFGFIDIVAAKAGEPLIGIQATSRTNISARVRKIRSIEAHSLWLSSGCRLLVVGLPRVVELLEEGTIDVVHHKKSRRGSRD